MQLLERTVCHVLFEIEKVTCMNEGAGRANSRSGLEHDVAEYAFRHTEHRIRNTGQNLGVERV